MLKVEVRERQDPSDRYLVINDVPVMQSWVSPHFENLLSCEIQDPSAVGIIKTYSLLELASVFCSLTLPVEGLSPFPKVEIGWDDVGEDVLLMFDTPIVWADWSSPWSINKYIDKFGLVFKRRNISESEFNDLNAETDPPTFGVSFFLESRENILSNVIDYYSGIVHSIVEEVEASLSANLQEDTVVTLFEFPPSVKTACEQYLLYFIQFLRDLGIEAEADLKHEAHNVLFSVTPQGGPEALKSIREALDAYLCLPNSPQFETEASQLSDIAVRQLEANVLYFKSQLALVSAILQAKDATIEALELSNFQYRQLLSEAQCNSQDATVVEPSSEKEPILDGLVQVTPYEAKGFTIQLPEILRRLKRRLSG